MTHKIILIPKQSILYHQNLSIASMKWYKTYTFRSRDPSS